MTKLLCSESIADPNSIEALMACRLTPLEKMSGVRPIGVGEVLRRIIGKAAMSVVRKDVLNATAYRQLFEGQ